MKHLTLTVLSNNPAGGRCTLYARFAEELSRSFGLKVQTIYPDKSHHHNAPGLLIDDMPVMPANGDTITPNDVCNAINQVGLDTADLTSLRIRLDHLVEKKTEGI